MNDLIVGIDLGTTNSELAIIQDGQPRVIQVNGSPIMPSCVGLDPSGKLIVGQTAKNQLVAAPESTILSIKRRMGETIKVPLGDKQFSPEEISSFILHELKLAGERELGQPISKAVITVPAFFNERQRKATQVAGELAGLEVVRILNEPTAAALAYGASQTVDETMLVYDLGGGTFDVSVVVVEQSVVEVKASHGDTHLGGDDFDQVLVDFAVRDFQQRHKVDLSLDTKTLRRLKVVLEHAKCRLSDEPYINVREEYIDSQHHLELEIMRDDYEHLILGLLEKTLDCVHKSMEDAKLLPNQIDKVMLVGGATRTPVVRRLLQERMGLDPRFEINPDLIVAMGAAIQAGIIAGQKHHSILVDITPHTFSTSCLSSSHGDWPQVICAPIIPRNTPLPTSKSELFATHYDNQSEVVVEAYQGEGLLPDQNVLIGDFRVEGLAKVPAGNPIVVNFALDLNGMLKVTATEKSTGLAKTVTMDIRSKNVLDLEQARRNVAALTGEPSPATPASNASSNTTADPAQAEAVLATAKNLRQRGEALLAKNISAEDANEIRSLIHQSTESIKNRTWDALAISNQALSDLLFYLED
ncbi:MAG: Hsp70 family protein [Candidatus Omnitrophica bacterium]|nr:Hsp70 family protein [Candidatus Omnitrophota bacterium]